MPDGPQPADLMAIADVHPGSDQLALDAPQDVGAPGKDAGAGDITGDAPGHERDDNGCTSCSAAAGSGEGPWRVRQERKK